MINIPSKKYVFVDCFDTLILRSCKPETVVKRWLSFIAEKYNASVEVVQKIFDLSRNPDKNLREERSFYDVAGNIYDRFQYLYSIDDDKETFTSYLLNTYLRIEERVTRVNQGLIDKLALLQESEIILVTDFYMPEVFFRRLFATKGIRIFDKIYVSSDVGFRKSTGSLYKYILNELRANPADCVMVGDNRVSDIKQPRSIGISAIKVQASQINDYSEKNKILDLFKKNERNSPLANYSFTLAFFIMELSKYVKDNSVTDVYFLSREGEFFKKIFETSSESLGTSKINTHYLLVSRKSTFLPSLSEDLDSEQFQTLRCSAKNLSLHDFLNTLGISDIKKIEEDCKKSGFNVDERKYDFFNSDSFRFLLELEPFRNSYKDSVASAKKNFREYLENNNIADDPTRLFIVDIGWKGTIQDNLYNYFEGKKPITGLYYGITNPSHFSKDNKKIGLVFSDIPFNSAHFDDFNTNHRILERVLQASHGSANSYKNGECRLLDFDEKEAKLRNFMCPVQSIMSKDIEFIIDELYGKYPMAEVTEIIASLHRLYLKTYSKELDSIISEITGLMLMTFASSDSMTCSMKAMAKSYFKLPSIERTNKTLKFLRKKKVHALADLIMNTSRKMEEKYFLSMEI